MGKSWIIASGKGGVGKSTLTAGLGLQLARLGQKVCIIDADIGLRDQDAILGVENCIVFDLIDAAEEICTLDQALVVPRMEDYPTLSLLPASQFARAKELEPKAFRKLLHQMKEDFDHILIDAPAGIERSLRGLLNEEIDETVLICTPDDICIRNAERTAGVMTGKGLPPPRVIVNRLNEAYIREGDMYSARTVAQTLDLALLGEMPEDPVMYRDLLKHRLPGEEKSEGHKALQRIAQRMLDADALIPFPDYGKEQPHENWLKRLLGRGRKETRHVR